MARTKRREKIAGIFEPTVETVPAISVVAKRYRTGIYVRLSVEDGGLGKESESFYNQERLLLDYVEGMPDLEVVKIYRDNGERGCKKTASKNPRFVKSESRMIFCIEVLKC